MSGLGEDSMTWTVDWKQMYYASWSPLGNGMSLSTLLLYTVLFLGLYLLMGSLWRYYKILNSNAPPGPKLWPVVGNFFYMLLPEWLILLLNFGIGSGKIRRVSAGATSRGAFLYPHIVLTEMAKIYGKIYGLYIGTRLLVILNDFNTVKDALVNHSEVFSDRPSVAILTIITKGKGIFCVSLYLMPKSQPTQQVVIMAWDKFTAAAKSNLEDPLLKVAIDVTITIFSGKDLSKNYNLFQYTHVELNRQIYRRKQKNSTIQH